jgi:hypothetical protein
MRNTGECPLAIVRILGSRSNTRGWLQDFNISGASFLTAVELRKGEIITLRRENAVGRNELHIDTSGADESFQMVTSEVIRCEAVLNGIFNYKVGVRHLLTYF